jgi:hypothetical protein
MNNDNIPLSLPTNRTVNGPTLRKDRGSLVLAYDYESDDGAMRCAEVAFTDVLIFEFRDSSCGRAEDVINPHIIRCQSQSAYLAEAVDLWQVSVGWQEWQQKRGGAQRFKHYTMDFDDAGSLDVVAAKCEATATRGESGVG